MKVIKWLVGVLLVVVLLLTACDQKEDASSDESGVMPRATEIQTDETVDQSEPVDAPEQADDSEEEAVTEAETTSKVEDDTNKVEDDTNIVEEAVSGILLDTEAMVDRLGNYLLRPDDMPHKYFIPEGGEQRMSTMRLIQNMGEIEAKTYVKETGRIDGWWLQLQRTSKADFAPGTFESSIELFQDANGAETAMSPGYYALYQDENREYSQVQGGCDLGDQCKFFYSEKEDPATELVFAQYNVAFTYRNAFVWVMARGLQVDMEADYVLDAARVVFEKLEEAPTQ